MMIVDEITFIVIATPLLLMATVAYVALLLAVAKRLSGKLKLSISLLIYMLFTPIFLSPLFYLLLRFKESPIIVIAGSALIFAPALYYIGRVKIGELQRAGYFILRK